jgi:hypothetical protein
LRKGERDISASISLVAVDLSTEPLLARDDPSVLLDPTYMVQLGRQMFDARHHWMGKINHLPTPHCNLWLDGRGRLIQTREIKVGEPLTYDYAIGYWVYRVTGIDVAIWLAEKNIACRRGRQELFTRMHKSVHNYSDILRQRWASSLTSPSSAVEREEVLIELEDYMDHLQS